MNEFIEKLIRRLEEKFKYNSEQAEIWRDGSDKDSYFREKKDLYLDRANIYGEIMRIVKQLAEEYKKENLFNLDYATLKNCPKCGAKAQHRVNRKGAWACGCFECNTFKCSYDHVNAIRQWEDYCFEHNGGWIPCSKRLPETNESVLCWAKSTARGGDVCFVGSCHNGFWFLQSSADTHSFPGQYVVVAWQPLPDPYKEPERVDRN